MYGHAPVPNAARWRDNKGMGKSVIFGQGMDEQTLAQYNSAMSQPWVVKGALMPDAHVGYSMPIGGVVATDGVIVPAWVGYDIGCGMCAAKTNLKAADIIPHRDEIFHSVYRAVPTGFSHNRRPERWDHAHLSTSAFLERVFEKDQGLTQLASLGGGNHFIEIDADEGGDVWVVTHSGSRHIGHTVATEYMKRASRSTRAREGHFGLQVNTAEGQDYIRDLKFCLEFALENRRRIIERVLREMYHYARPGQAPEMERFINRNHNHAEEKDGLWIHRKGATHAEAGMEGVIPGNMRDGSFIVIGKGNPDSLYSSSHGAGRALSRTAAKSIITLDEFRKEMAGITSKVTGGTLDEAPRAYKDIFEIIRQQEDLVEVTHHLRPIINIKA